MLHTNEKELVRVGSMEEKLGAAYCIYRDLQTTVYPHEPSVSFK